MKLWSVNEILEDKEHLHGQRVYVEGLLSFDIEDISLHHWPKTEQSSKSIWVEEGAGVFRYNIEALTKLRGKKVVCLGEFQSLITEKNVEWEWGFGHMSLWPAQIVATELVYYKKWYKANG